ncbi:MAG: bifunctional phosphoribosylaminoimidazolecarboxamide formyltransferase/IMP cyclohydrolase [Thermoanaerobaculia bacterium]
MDPTQSPALPADLARPVRRALLSVSDRTGLVELARGLTAAGVEIISTGGTAKFLAEQGIPSRKAEEVTGFPEVFGGRVKTLHPKIFGAILGNPADPAHEKDFSDQKIQPIDLVAVNLYPFEDAVAHGARGKDAIEKIDIGGPAMIRAAAKNHARVTVLVDPSDYAGVLAEIRDSGGTSAASRERLASKAFARTAVYDSAIANYFSRELSGGEPFPDTLLFAFEKQDELRYGENPHQQAAVYRDRLAPAGELTDSRQIQGKELSFNNLLDLDSALRLARDFRGTTAVIVKHNNPCGVAVGETLLEAFGRAFACDPLAAFGGIIALRGKVDGTVASLILQHFVEAVVADDFTEEAKALFVKKPNIRLLQLPVSQKPAPGPDWKRIGGGLLLQSADDAEDDAAAWKIVSQRRPLAIERAACELAWTVARRVKSNAIVVANARQTVGIGAGQMSRVDSCRLAITKANLALTGCGAASDAFFPFRDGLDILADAGVTAVVAPGGSIRDAEIFAAADERKMALLLAPHRHFRH